MQIWTLTTNDDNGTCASVCYTEHDADNAAWEYLQFHWDEYHDTEPMPDNWHVALEKLNDCTGFMDYCHVEEHDISAHPALWGSWIIVTNFKQINRRDVDVLWDGEEPVAYRVNT